MSFELALATLTFATNFFGGDDQPSDLPNKKRDEPKSNSFLNLKSGLDAYSSLRKKNETPAFQTAEFKQTRSVNQLTNPKSFQPLGNMRFITGAENADLQNAMRVLSNAQNKQVAQLIPYNAIGYKGGPAPNIQIGSTDLPRSSTNIRDTT
tara:strand:- start:125 stop:577 length:453 start_codon:yes stop_codon:yes gene_type:complete